MTRKNIVLFYQIRPHQSKHSAWRCSNEIR